MTEVKIIEVSIVTCSLFNGVLFCLAALYLHAVHSLGIRGLVSEFCPSEDGQNVYAKAFAWYAESITFSLTVGIFSTLDYTDAVKTTVVK